MAYLIVVGGPNINTVHRIHPQGSKVARGMQSLQHLSIERDPSISRRSQTAAQPQLSVGEVGHAQFYRDEEGYWCVRDIGSKNGIFFVDGKGVVQLIKGASMRLKPATLLECGQSPILFLNIDEKPAEKFITAATRKDGQVRHSSQIGHPPHEGLKTTAALDKPEAEEPVLSQMWSTIRAAMKVHGYGHLLKS